METLKTDELHADCELLYGWIVRYGRTKPVNPGPDRVLPEERCRVALAWLRERHLIAYDPESDSYLANPPKLAAALLIGDREAELRAKDTETQRALAELTALRTTVGAFSPVYHQARAHSDESTSIQILDDGPAVQSILNALTADAEHEVMACQPGGMRAESELAQALPRDLELLARGVRLRSIYQHTAQRDGPTVAYATAATRAGSEIRICDELPPRMIIVDRETAVIPHRARTSGAIVIREPSTLAFLCAVFEMTWNSATPLGGKPRSDGDLDALSLKILELLARGLTDKAIGARLAISDRAVRERVAGLYRSLGAASRFEAGFIAGTLGLVDRENTT